MKFRTLQDAYTGIYRPIPKFSDYISHEDRLVIIERKSSEEKEITEKSITLYNDLAAASNGMLRVDEKESSNTLAYFKRKGARLGLTNLGKQQTPESYNFDFVKQMAESSGATIEDTIGIPPTRQQRFARITGKELSLSSAFNTYYVGRDNIMLPVVICARFNKGNDFEEILAKNFQQQLEDKKLEQGGLLEQVLSSIGIADQYQHLKLHWKAGYAAKRELGYTEDQIVDAGKKIADLTIKNTKNNEEYYISLKDKNGKTFGQKGVSGIFKDTSAIDPETGASKLSITIGSNTVLDDYFAAINGDAESVKLRICQGLEEYASGVVENTPKTTEKYYFENVDATSAFIKIVQTAIKCGLGYGYYYLKNKNSARNQFIMIDITTREKLDKFIDRNVQIESLSVQFPYFVGDGSQQSTKSFNVYAHTKNGSNYELSLRTKNANKFVPSEWVLSVTKMEINPEDKDKMILSVIPPAVRR